MAAFKAVDVLPSPVGEGPGERSFGRPNYPLKSELGHRAHLLAADALELA